jgi:AcrR family transcriptional regulator
MAAKTRRKQSRLEGARERMYHDLIFESAECVFGEKGFENATMQEIASEAGISLKTLYGIFEGKQELFDEIQRVRGEAFMEHVAAATALGTTPLERLELSVRAYVEFVLRHRDWLRIHLRTGTSWSLRPRKEYAARAWKSGLENVASILGDGMAAGLFYEDEPFEKAALVQAILQVHVSRLPERGEVDVESVVAPVLVELQRLLCRPEVLAEEQRSVA